MNFFDTIAAISTPRGKGGIAVIRISGPDAAAVGDAVFSRKLSLAEPNLELHGAIYLPLPGGERRQIDDGMAVIFRAPRSFTGEDTVEISCHGGVLVTQAVLTACFAAGARQAEPVMAPTVFLKAFSRRRRIFQCTLRSHYAWGNGRLCRHTLL